MCVIVVAGLAARFSPHAPAPLIGVALAILIARVFDLREREVGALPAMLPPFAARNWSLKGVMAALAPAFALALVSSVNILIRRAWSSTSAAVTGACAPPTPMPSWALTALPIRSRACSERR
jgi:MFS superfamily sulfate permease-like transporter